MTIVLNARQRSALDQLSNDHGDFLAYGQFRAGTGAPTLDSLVELGLAEKGPSGRFFGETGWHITDAGWRCMYGKTYAEIMAPGAEPSHPLKVWSWPPSDR
jgi:hypothetical protein